MFTSSSLPSLLLYPVDSLVSYAQEKLVETVSSYLRKRVQKILYVGAGFGALALLAAYVAKIALTFFCMVGAVFCFWLTLWIFQEREKENSERFSRELEAEKENVRKQSSLNQDLKEKSMELEKINSELKEENESLASCNQQLSGETSQLKEQNVRLEQNCERFIRLRREMKNEDKALRGHIAKLTSSSSSDSEL